MFNNKNTDWHGSKQIWKKMGEIAMCKRTSVLGTCRKNYLFIFDSQFILSHICEACPLQVAM